MQFVVYTIRNTKTKMAYFGVTRNWNGRKGGHKWELRQGTHRNRPLQEAWNECGEDAFQFEIIEAVVTESNALRRELFWINHSEDTYNIRGKDQRKKKSKKTKAAPLDPSPASIIVRQAINFTPLEPQARYNLLRLAHLYRNATEYAFSTISRRSHGDPRFFDMLLVEHKKVNRTDSKGSFTLRMYDKLIKWFYENWPDHADFPVLDDLSYTKGNHDGRQTQGFEESPQRPHRSEKAPQEQQGARSQTASDRLRKLRGLV